MNACTYCKSRFVLFPSRTNPLISMNYAIFQYNQGLKKEALQQFQDMEKRVNKLKESNSNTEFDPEVSPCTMTLMTTEQPCLTFQ